MQIGWRLFSFRARVRIAEAGKSAIGMMLKNGGGLPERY